MKAVFFLLAIIAIAYAQDEPLPKDPKEWINKLCDAADDSEQLRCCVDIAIAKACTEIGMIRDDEDRLAGIWVNVTYLNREILKKEINFAHPLEGDNIVVCRGSRWLKTEVCLFADNVESSLLGICGCFRASLSSPLVNTQKNFGLVKMGKVDNCPVECA